jgi:outer membrane protein assembly factor BamB
MTNSPIDQSSSPTNVPNTQANKPNERKPLRLWPGVVAVVIQWLFWFVLPVVIPKAGMIGMLGGVICGLLVIIWWLFFSRARWLERVGAILLIVIAIAATKRIVHPSIAGGAMGMLLFVYAIPIMSLTLLASAALGRRFSKWPRRGLMAAAIVVACLGFTLLRTGGISAEGDSDLHWRWSKTPEEKLLAQGDEPTAPIPTPPTSDIAKTGSDWPGFRGSNRDSIVRGARIETDWSQKPPVQIWRRPIGPAWSSFSVGDNLFYTQEQRGDHETVSCYTLTTGQPVWKHRDAARFYESNAGAGPRGTPTLHDGRLYTLGGTGILNALNARNGSVIWSRNAASDTKATLPAWGFAGSPLVVGDVVIVATAGVLAAYDIANGNPRWQGPTGARGYSSPHLVTIGGTQQILLLSTVGVISVAPNDGAILWKHAWDGDGIVQPAVTADGDVLLGSGSGMGSKVGILRLAVAKGGSGWNTTERWTSYDLNPYFNDFVVHKDHAYGFDGSEISCIETKNGAGKWKGGHYGQGQLVLLSDQDLLLVLSETGDVALVKAAPDQFVELARFKAIEGKTWNHPVLVGDILLVRNSEEMAAFRMSLIGGK